MSAGDVLPAPAQAIYPTTLKMSPKEAAIILDAMSSGSLADGLAHTPGDTLGFDGWQALELALSDKLGLASVVQVDSAAEALLIEHAFSDSTQFVAYAWEDPGTKGAMRRLANSLQAKLSSCFHRPIALPAELVA